MDDKTNLPDFETERLYRSMRFDELVRLGSALANDRRAAEARGDDRAAAFAKARMDLIAELLDERAHTH
jgi:hypothetical protein